MKANPDAYQSEVAEYFGCSAPTVCRELKRLGLTRKKKTKRYKEQDPIKVALYLSKIKNIPKAKMAYIDETGIDTYLHREYCYAKKTNYQKSSKKRR